MSNEPIIKIRDLAAGYNGTPVIRGITFDVGHGEIVAIMGPNGAGKSTLLRAMLGLAKIFSGSIEILSFSPVDNLSHIRKYVGYVPQRENISPNIPIRVKDIVLSGILLRRGPLSIPTRRDILKVKEILNRVGLPRELWFRKFNELSGGEQQKALLARALVSEPKILLLDEPFSAVDIKSQREIMGFLAELKREKGVGILLVVHDINEIMDYIDKIVLVNKRMIAWGDPSVVLTPKNLKEAYGVEIEVITYRDKCLALIGDRHA